MFGKKATAEEVMKLFSALSDEEKQKFLFEVNGADKRSNEELESTDEGKAAETPADAEGKEPEEGEAAAEQSSDEAKPEEEVQEAPAAEEERAENTDVDKAAEPSEETAEQPMDDKTAENLTETVKGLADRIQALEQFIKQIQDSMQKKADSFGYKGTVQGARKSYEDMSASELKQQILQGKI